jgi:hypothetical protein
LPCFPSPNAKLVSAVWYSRFPVSHFCHTIL